MTGKSSDAAPLALRRWKRRCARVLPPVLFFVALVVAWQYLLPAIGVRAYLVPPPLDILKELAAEPFVFLEHTGVTVLESLAGFLLALVLGVTCAVLFVHSRGAERTIFPYIILLKAVPLIAIAPILILWFGNGMSGKIVMSALICFFPIVVSTTVGLRDISPASLDLMHSLSASRRQILTKIRFPAAAPHIFSALKVASTLSVIGSIVGELAGADRGIGYLILVSSYRMDTASMFAAVILCAIAGLLFFGAISIVERRVLRWHQAYAHGAETE